MAQLHSKLLLDRRALVRGAMASGRRSRPRRYSRRQYAPPERSGSATSARRPALAAFAEADNFVIVNFLNTVRDGLRIGNETYPVEVSVKDSQSNPNRAADVARELIVGSKVDLMLVASTPETTNPVATMCEVEETPCISSVAPWQPYFIGRQQNPRDPASWKPFSSTFHFFWGLEDVIAVFTNMCEAARNQQIGGRAVSERRRRQCLGRQAGGLPAGAREARLQAHRSRPLPEPHR